ncbi:MAG: hypothetical protein GKR89_01775 [Candidatus Latescibacteria bacterium]|nr:hypothetical protein [Candidatus Latescibacterota bacterium]
MERLFYWKRLSVDYAHEEAAAVAGEDPRHFSLSTKRFIDDGQGRLAGLETVQVEWRPDGPVEVPGSDRVWPAQLALLAMGWLGPEDTLFVGLDLERDKRFNAQAVYGEYATNIPGVFAAGDMRRGASLVVWAIHEGRGAARACDGYLMGQTQLPF